MEGFSTIKSMIVQAKPVTVLFGASEKTIVSNILSWKYQNTKEPFFERLIRMALS